MKLGDLWGNVLAVLRAKWYLRRCDMVGAKARVWGRPVIKNYGRMLIGERLRLTSTTARCELFSGPDGTLEIGEGVFINYGVAISAQQLVRIGDACSFGPQVLIMDNDYHAVDDRERTPPSQSVILERNVWLGARVIVLKGVTIGENSVVGAGSVVTRDIPANVVAVGSPARVLRDINVSDSRAIDRDEESARGR